MKTQEGKKIMKEGRKAANSKRKNSNKKNDSNKKPNRRGQTWKKKMQKTMSLDKLKRISSSS